VSIRRAAFVACLVAICCLATSATAVESSVATSAASDPPRSPLLRITRAERFVDLDDWERWRQRGPPPDARWTPVTLPIVDRDGTDGGRVTTWYRFRYPYAGGDRVAIYVPRVIVGDGFPPVFLANGVVLEDRGWYAGFAGWLRPEFVVVPQQVTPFGESRTVEIVIAMRYESRGGHALAAPWIGPSDVLYARASAREFRLMVLPQAMALALLVLGAFALAYWIRRREPTYLLFALATVAWNVRTLHYWIVDPRMPIEWFWWLTLNSLTWLMVLVYLFAFRFHERRVPAVERALIAAAAGVSVLTLALLTKPWLLSSVGYAAQAVIGLVVTVLITRESWRARRLELSFVAAALWLNLGLGIHDLLLRANRLDIEGYFLLPYGALALFGSFLYAVQKRYVGAIVEVERVNASLEERLAARTRELQASHERLRDIERRETLAAERERLMRDMHDGLGSALMSSLVLVEQGRLPPADVARVLRECIDDLKLTIDSLEPIESDLVTLLATLRYRLGRRLEAAGVTLEWQVGDLPPLEWLDARAALEVLRILQEALTNVMKHAGARRVAISTLRETDEVRVRVADDGRGFDVAAQEATRGGRGLTNLSRRATRIGGRVEVASGPGGTTVDLWVPLSRREASPAPAPAHERAAT
jgi:signal transduction histidine kinase